MKIGMMRTCEGLVGGPYVCLILQVKRSGCVNGGATDISI